MPSYCCRQQRRGRCQQLVVTTIGQQVWNWDLGRSFLPMVPQLHSHRHGTASTIQRPELVLTITSKLTPMLFLECWWAFSFTDDSIDDCCSVHSMRTLLSLTITFFFSVDQPRSSNLLQLRNRCRRLAHGVRYPQPGFTSPPRQPTPSCSSSSGPSETNSPQGVIAVPSRTCQHYCFKPPYCQVTSNLVQSTRP